MPRRAGEQPGVGYVDARPVAVAAVVFRADRGKGLVVEVHRFRLGGRAGTGLRRDGQEAVHSEGLLLLREGEGGVAPDSNLQGRGSRLAGLRRAEADELDAVDDVLGFLGRDQFHENVLRLVEGVLPDQELAGGVHVGGAPLAGGAPDRHPVAREFFPNSPDLFLGDLFSQGLEFIFSVHDPLRS